MSSFNKAIIVGRLGKDPEVRQTSGGTSVASFSLATSESYTDKQGNKQEKTQWHNIVAWSGLADLAGKYLKKGSECLIEGTIEYRSYGEENAKKWITEIKATELRFMGKAPESSGNQRSSGNSAKTSDSPPPAAGNVPDNGDLPF